MLLCWIKKESCSIEFLVILVEGESGKLLGGRSWRRKGIVFCWCFYIWM